MATPRLLALLPLLALSGCALMTHRKAWPDHAGEVAVRGPTKSVTVIRDELGVPHIRAESRTDAVFALGFVHAQDRLFQADLTRRLIYGELSTLLGERSVEIDGFTGGLEIRKRAEALVAKAPFEVQAVLEAYALGMNAGRDSLGALPVEYGLLGVDSVPDWTPADCVASVYLQSWNLSENPDQEMAALALRDLDAKKVDALLRFEAETPALDGYWNELRSADLGPWTPGWRSWSRAMGGGVDETSEASNNWIVGGSRSADGLPIVANDPHLGQRVPSIWYVADLAGGDMHVAGATFPGTPAVVIGHNGKVAWGLTNVMADYIDFAVLDTADEGRSVVLAGETVPLREVTVDIAVKKSEPVKRTTLWTPIGPVISAPDREQVVVLRWHALELEDRSTEGWWKLNRAQTVQEAIEAMSRPMMVAQNLVVADVSGDFAWQSVGSVPVRKAHTGRVPYPGSDPAHGWDGWYAALPGERAPERGWVATANQRPRTDRPAGPPAPAEGEPAPEAAESEPIDVHGISTGWSQRWRYERIAEQLDSREKWTPEQTAALQTDVRDLAAATLIPELLDGVEGSTSAARKCHKILAAWDHQADVDQPGATVWLNFQRELLREALLDDLGEDGLQVYLQAHGPGRNLVGVDLTPFVKDLDDAVDNALTATCSRMEANWGESEEGWLWGDAHVLGLRHPFGDASFLLKGWNAPERRFPGNSNTVAAAAVGWGEGEQFVGGMASLRVVMPLSDLARSTLVHPGGQSGLPKHPQAFTHFDAFVEGRTLPLYFSTADVLSHAVDTQTLVPPGAAGPAVAPEPQAAPVEEPVAVEPSGEEPAADVPPSEPAAEEQAETP